MISPTKSELTATKLFSRNREGMFQQDGARAHTINDQRLQSPGWTQILNTTFRRRSEDWPANSPDLCPIENIWSIMATAVYADPEPQSLRALKHRLRKAWKSISLSTLRKLIGSMPNRLKAVIKNSGDTIPY